MEKYFLVDEWNVIEEGFKPEKNRLSESIMSLGNGYMGIRGNFTEFYSGDSLKGTYIAGVYYPDKTRVGWWKIGYPEYYAKVINAPDFTSIDVFIDGERLDLAKVNFKTFKRQLNMKEGYVDINFIIADKKGHETEIKTRRFISLSKGEIAAISYTIIPLNYDGEIELIPLINGDISNEDSNYGEKFWDEINKNVDGYYGYLTVKTKKLDFHVTVSMKYNVTINGKIANNNIYSIIKEKYVASSFKTYCKKGEIINLNKYIAITSNRYYNNDELIPKGKEIVEEAFLKGFDKLFSEHSKAWEKQWEESDIVITGDAESQQAIRFNIFHLNQTYNGKDPRLNIGPKGFTGEKYGGSTYWDTEAFCFPFYLCTHDKNVARNLLLYRYNHLEKAKENAKKLGLKGALYPMVTMNGEECHNEWEITFEEIHRNAAISYAIYNYVRYTKDESYLADYGFEVLVETSRFWESRVNYNATKDKYMILGVTGPNEYENNVNNNWYTNTMASWNLSYTMEVAKLLKEKYPEKYNNLVNKLQLKECEFEKWQDIVNKMYYPYVESLQVFEQQDGYMDKEQKLVSELSPDDLPLNQKWSWDRILRSCFIKQADVIQGLYFLNERYDIDTIKRNFDFYEPKTVHESSLSACIHSVIASQIGYHDKAYELFLRSSRLDLDNYNNDTNDGLHITSMAGTWLAITQGFGGMKVINDKLCFKPYLPSKWKAYSFKILFRDHLLKININSNNVIITQEKGSELIIKVYDKEYTILKDSTVIVEK
ncbi:glycoside hydrolase family 65 protein [Caloramator sp. E03]|uniref:family 65 glycosyl hydrolase domain-containing protein n=1 Tax=Caloramator sp. E03 TaxID=2576307 RepID=UPI001110BF52|nr:family 65 glycosyl hydrolase domain-containing protein [Caloramator sp. E03]QCX33023.1 glycoside hydrolase family 65 protein [Caloramator sp. E03]